MTHVDAVVRFYENLSLSSLQGGLRTTYAKDARFTDPFNDVTGRVAIERIFFHMFASVEEPRFKVTRSMAQGSEAFLTWEFSYRTSSLGQQCIVGASHLVFDEEGKVQVHRDYWDAAGELYERVPVLGALMRFLRRRLSAG